MTPTTDTIRPSRLKGILKHVMFISSNSKDHLIEIDLGFTINPIYRQEKIVYFLPDNIYYQQLVMIDGKQNPVKDDCRTLVFSGSSKEDFTITFFVTIYGSLPASADIDQNSIALSFYPELDTIIVIRDKRNTNIFYEFSCSKILHKANAAPFIQLRYLGDYTHGNLAAVLNKWHPERILLLENIAAQ